MIGPHAAEIDRAHRLAGDGNVEAAVDLLSELLQSTPGDVELLSALGSVSRAAGLLDNAEQAYRAALEHRPNAVDNVVNLANVLVAKGETTPAITILARIHRLAPRLLPATLSLGAALCAAGRGGEALTLYDMVLAEHPTLAQAHANRAEVLARLGLYRESLAAAERAHRIDPHDPGIALNRAFALLLEGRVADGLAAYEARLDMGLATAPVRTGLAIPRWAGDAPPDEPLLVASEQGLGDEIRFGAMVWALARSGVKLVVEADPRLVPLLGRSLAGAEVRPYDRRRSGMKPIFRYGWLDRLPVRPAAWIEAGSLPLRLGLSPAAPVAPAGYLRPDPDRVAAFRQWLAPARADGRPVIGIVWGSGRLDAARRRFYAPLDAWAPVLTLPGVRFVDLQYTESAADRAALEARFGIEILPVDGLDKRNDLDGAAALAVALDAVVGISSSVTALAGAAGTPTVEVMAERIWLPRAAERDSLLGPVRFAEAETPGNWEGAMTHAATALAGLLTELPARR